MPKVVKKPKTMAFTFTLNEQKELVELSKYLQLQAHSNSVRVAFMNYRKKSQELAQLAEKYNNLKDRLERMQNANEDLVSNESLLQQLINKPIL